MVHLPALISLHVCSMSLHVCSMSLQNKTCVQTLEGHAQNVSAVAFHPELPIIITGSEDGTVRVWHSNTYRLETTLNYGLDRVWCMAHCRGSHNIALGYDEGSILVKVGNSLLGHFAISTLADISACVVYKQMPGIDNASALVIAPVLKWLHAAVCKYANNPGMC